MKNSLAGASLGSGILLNAALGAPWWIGTSLLAIVAVSYALTACLREIFPQESADRAVVLRMLLARSRSRPAHRRRTRSRRGADAAASSESAR